MQRCSAIAAYWGTLSGRGCASDDVEDVAGLKLDLAAIFDTIKRVWEGEPGRPYSIRYFWQALQESESANMKNIGNKRHFGGGFAIASSIMPNLMP